VPQKDEWRLRTFLHGDPAELNHVCHKQLKPAPAEISQLSTGGPCALTADLEAPLRALGRFSQQAVASKAKAEQLRDGGDDVGGGADTALSGL